MLKKAFLLPTLLLTVCALQFMLSAPALSAAKDDIVAGIKAARSGQQEKAIKLFTRAIDSGKLSRTNLAIAYTNRGSAHDDLNRADQAVGDFNSAIKADPKFSFAYYNRSYAYEKKGLLKLALKDMETAAGMEPGDADYKDRLKYLKFKASGKK